MMEVAIRCPKRGTACSRQINRVLRQAPAGSRIVFEPGEYLIDEKLLLCDRKNLFLDGAGATLVLRNDRERNYRYSTDGIHVERCSDITIANFRIRAQYPSNTGYRVLEVTPDAILLGVIRHEDETWRGVAERLRTMDEKHLALADSLLRWVAEQEL